MQCIEEDLVIREITLCFFCNESREVSHAPVKLNLGLSIKSLIQSIPCKKYIFKATLVLVAIMKNSNSTSGQIKD